MREGGISGVRRGSNFDYTQIPEGHRGKQDGIDPVPAVGRGLLRRPPAYRSRGALGELARANRPACSARTMCVVRKDGRLDRPDRRLRRRRATMVKTRSRANWATSTATCGRCRVSYSGSSFRLRTLVMSVGRQGVCHERRLPLCSLLHRLDLPGTTTDRWRTTAAVHRHP